MADEQSQNGRGGYQIDKIAYAKGGGTCAHKRGFGKDKKTFIRAARTKWMGANKCYGIFFEHWSG